MYLGKERIFLVIAEALSQPCHNLFVLPKVTTIVTLIISLYFFILLSTRCASLNTIVVPIKKKKRKVF